MAGRTPVVVLKGGDEILLAAARVKLVAQLVGTEDASLLVAELAGDEYEMAELVDAAQTPPFLTDYRVVVGRGMQRFTKADHAILLDYLADPLDSTVLVLEWGGSGRLPKPVAEAVTKAGGDLADTGAGRNVAEWGAQQLATAGLKLDRDATRLVTGWLGDDGGKLPGLIAVLASTYGEGARLAPGDIEPFLGDAGGVPPWDLTDAIDKGDLTASLVALHRMLGAGRHPLQVLATVHSHLQRILRLDGSGARGEKEAAALLGLKGSTFPAKKALAQANKRKPGTIQTAIGLVAAADLDLKGAIDWPSELVMEVLVARLAHLSR